jgi:hypothetical protein
VVLPEFLPPVRLGVAPDFPDGFAGGFAVVFPGGFSDDVAGGLAVDAPACALAVGWDAFAGVFVSEDDGDCKAEASPPA